MISKYQEQQNPEKGFYQKTRPYKLILILFGNVFLFFLYTLPVRANTINVTTTTPGVLLDGQCSLIEAIENAEDIVTGQPHPDCDLGDPSGADTINLLNATYNVTTVWETDLSGNMGLPAINTEITFMGNGAVIQGMTISPTVLFRMLKINATGTVTITNLTLTGGNFPTNGGGGIYNLGVLSLNNATITNNTASTGGGIENDNGTAVITDSTISNNTATRQGGGGIWNNASAVMTINNSLITNNETTGDGSSGFEGHGGGIVNKVLFGAEPQLTINDSTISENISSNEGGGISNEEGTLTVNHTTINNNTAAMHGGGIRNLNNLGVEINHSTISGNSATAGSGGGIYNFANNHFSDPISSTHVTITGNSASINGGGISHSQSFGIVDLNLAQTLVSGNIAPTGREVFNNTVIIVDAYNLFGFSNSPGLSGLAPGGTDIVPTVTLAAVLDTTLTSGTHALPSGSPAIDGVGSCLATEDQRSEPRNDWACDIGAFEMQFSDGDTVTKLVVTGGTSTFGPTLVRTQIVDDGGCLTRLTIQRIESDHPDALPGIQTGRYWDVTPSGCTSGFTVIVTLPYDVTPTASDKACRYTGSGWECGQDADNSSAGTGPAAMPNIVIRQNVALLSDWAVGVGVGPTAVALQFFSVNIENGWGTAVLFAFLLLASLFMVVRQRAVQRR